MVSEKYDPKIIEGKWQQVWADQNVFHASEESTKPKYFCLCMFPYPSGNIHMGHMRNYSIGDIISRYKRMRGFNVLQPIGWDSFGLPAENAAIQRGVHPRDWTLQNIAQMKTELKSMGIAYDWDREVTTCLPDYYRWEQMLFCKFFEKGFAYKKTGQVNWCPKCETVLANEQVQEGACWRCDSPVNVKELSQWYLKITAYADELLSGHKQLEKKWPQKVLEMQKHWIGESHGGRIQFQVEEGEEKIEIFTTRPDTLFGVTFLTIAAAHSLAEKLCKAPNSLETLQKIKLAVALRRPNDEIVDKKGFFTGSYAIHPLTGKKVPVWVGDFVVMEYGTGAVMAVPAHDQRDFEFAKTYQLPIKQVIVPKGEKAKDPLTESYTEFGDLIESGSFTGMDNETAKKAIITELENKRCGVATIQYRLRDWGVSRQRFWGAPIPIIYCDSCGTVPVPEKDLPVQLPMDVVFSGKQGNPLEQHPTFSKTSCPKCQKPARRETDTLDTFVESSWYYARYTDPKCTTGPFSKAKADYWLPVDYYVGGVEHACMHLLYSRFIHKILRDWGYLSGDEPFSRLLTQGMVIKDGSKMSKSKGNVVTPGSILDRFGADTARLFSLFAAPPEKDLDWNEKGVEGCHRFLQRLWRLFYQHQTILAEEPIAEKEVTFSEKCSAIRRKTHWMIQKMTDDIESEKFNVAISAAMELVNELYGALTDNDKFFATPDGKWVLGEAMKSLSLCLAPFAPHLMEELWYEMGHRNLIASANWPEFRADLLVASQFTLVVQVNGKVRDRIDISKGLSKDEVQKIVMEIVKLKPFIEGKTLKQFIYVKERLANVVVV